MGRYNVTPERKSGFNETPEIHPIWRGIGFLLIILIPIISYFAGLLVIDANKIHNYVAIPPDLINTNGDAFLFVKIIMTVVIAFVIYMVFMLITLVAFRLFGPAQYGPTDAPPPRRKIHRRY